MAGEAMRRPLRARPPIGTLRTQVLTTGGAYGNARDGATQGQGAARTAAPVEGVSGRDRQEHERAGDASYYGVGAAEGGAMITTTERRAFGTVYRQKRSPFLWVRYRVNGEEF